MANNKRTGKPAPKKEAPKAGAKPAKPAKSAAAKKPVIDSAKKPAAKPAAKPVARPAAKPVAKPAAKPVARPAAKQALKPAAKVLARKALPAPKAAAKPKPAAKVLARKALPAPAAAAKPANPPAPKPERKQPARPAAKGAAKPAPGASKTLRNRAAAVRESAMLAARRRAEALRRARHTDAPIGDAIDLFLELPDAARRARSAPVLKDPAKLRAVGEGGHAMPPAFDRTRIVLLTRDPEWIFAFWEVTNRKLEEISEHLGVAALEDAKMVLRVHEVTGIAFDGGNARSSFDIEIEGKVSNWYIHVPKSDAEYCVEIGLLLRDGRLVRIARSNVTKVPPAGVSASVDVEWGVPDRDFVQLYRIAGGRAGTGKGGRAERAADADGSSGGMGSGMGAGGEDLSSGAPHSMMGPDVSSEELSSGALQMMGPGVSSEELSSGVLQMMGPGVSSEELSSGAFPGPGVSSEELGSGVLAMPPGIPGRKGVEGARPGKGKGRGGETPEADDFFLWVRTELILYGGTEPDAKVTVAGMPVKLRRDGTFSFRFDLPDGDMNLEVHAVKHNDRHERRITPLVSKRTV